MQGLSAQIQGAMGNGGVRLGCGPTSMCTGVGNCASEASPTCEKIKKAQNSSYILGYTSFNYTYSIYSTIPLFYRYGLSYLSYLC